MHGDPRYATPNAITYPPVTRKAILPYYQKLIRAFGKLAEMPVGIQEARTRNYTRDRRSAARRCWASTKPSSGHGNGWGRMIHDASHEIFEVRHPRARPHDGGHATLEREMAAYVEARGWLVQTAKPVTPKLDATAKLARIEAAIIRWNAKRKRAETALKKLHRKAKYYRGKI